jgi:predicted phage replisome organizer
MAEVKWIKLNVAMFDDDKIRIIETMPEADSILVIWVKLLTLAGKKNMNGYIFLTENIPYTDEMLAGLFNRPLTTVRLALETFNRFNMINYNESNHLHITNWDKHQNIEGLDKIREQTRRRVADYRERQKELPEPEPTECNVTGNATVTQGNATEIDIEEDKEIDNISLSEKPKDKKSSPKKAERVFVKGDLEFTIAVYILNKIREINPGFKKPNIQTWCKDVDAILRIDERDQAELKEVIDWIYDDDFWNDKILSPSKLRKQYDSVNTKRLAEELKGPKQRQIHYFVDDKPAPQRERHLPTPEDLGH